MAGRRKDLLRSRSERIRRIWDTLVASIEKKDQQKDFNCSTKATVGPQVFNAQFSLKWQSSQKVKTAAMMANANCMAVNKWPTLYPLSTM